MNTRWMDQDSVELWNDGFTTDDISECTDGMVSETKLAMYCREMSVVLVMSGNDVLTVPFSTNIHVEVIDVTWRKLNAKR